MILPPLRARATEPPPPRRILFLVTSHGTVDEAWRIRQGRPDDVDYELPLDGLLPDEMSPILAPLWNHRQKLVVLDGIGNGCAATAGFLAHPAGNASCQTGAVPVDVPGSFSQTDGPSLDQVLAEGQDTPFPSLEWGIGGPPVSYDTLGQPLPFEQDPVAAWNRLFPTARTPVRPRESQAIRSRQTSLLDFAVGCYDDTIARLPVEERTKIELHRDLVRDLEVRITRLDALRCRPPPLPDPEAFPLPVEADYPGTLYTAFSDLALAALGCGMTNVITLRVDTVPTATIGAPPGDLHTDIAHRTGTDPRARGFMTRHHTFHARQLSILLDRMDGIPEGNGTLLDHTLVVWHNEMATGDHRFHTVPMVIAGGGPTLRTGRYHRWAPQYGIEGRSGVEWMGQPHNRALTTLGVAMGLDIDAFGVRELPLTDGETLDCTGVLDGVLT